MKQRVLFLCTGNSCRSQMAEGWLRHLGGDRFESHSAGTRPSVVHPLAVRAMSELGIDIGANRSKHVDEYSNTWFDSVITVCDNAKEQCPVYLRPAEHRHWSFPDPAEARGSDDERLRVFREVRDAIGERIRGFLAEEK